MESWGYGLALAAGISFVFQQAVNANLRIEIGSAWWAGFVSYHGGTLVMLAAAMLVREPLNWSSAVAEGRWLSWTGGIFWVVSLVVGVLVAAVMIVGMFLLLVSQKL
jgi:bacterial/archaeal transporter family-2 protein